MSFAFGKEWRDDAIATKLNSVLLLTAVLIAVTIYMTMPDQKDTAMIFILMGVMMAIIGGLDTANENHPTVGAAGFGSINRMLISAVVGGALAYLLLGNIEFAITPKLAITSDLMFLYIVFMSPVLEEFFFRGGLVFTMSKFMPGIVAILAQAALFGSWHYVAYGGDISAMYSAALFGIVAAVGNQVFESIGFSISLHIVWNYLVNGGA